MYLLDYASFLKGYNLATAVSLVVLDDIMCSIFIKHILQIKCTSLVILENGKNVK